MSTFSRSTGVNGARVVTVIEINSLAGNGTNEHPYIEVTEYYSFDGELLARRNPNDLGLGVWEHPNTEKEA